MPAGRVVFRFSAIRRLHREQRGTISIVTVFAAMLLTMLLGMVMNVGRQVNGKIRMQNAADAATYSGGVVIARGMNTLAFTNHLLCDVFAMTALMREARDRNAESYVPAVLAAWSNVGPRFVGSGFPKFEALGPAILRKVPLEQELVGSFSDWAAASSQRVLPVMEEILARELIPEYQRAVVSAVPDVAQAAAMEVARRNGRPDHGRGDMLGALWRASGRLVGGENELFDPTLPVVDPVLGMGVPGPACPGLGPGQQRYVDAARRQRTQLANRYLRDWNNQVLRFFDREAKMCQFAALWRSFTCGQLKRLLEEEYACVNLPHVIRTEKDEVVDANRHLEQNFTFVGVAYWRKGPQLLPGLFRNPMENDAVAYAEVRVFIPRRRLVWRWHGGGGGGGGGGIPIGGVPGEFPTLSSVGDPGPGTGGRDGPGYWRVGRQGVPTHWDLLNQHWTCQLAPATQSSLTTILQTVPPLPSFGGEDFVLPNLGNLGPQDIGLISPH